MTREEILKHFRYEDDGRLFRKDTRTYPSTIGASGYYVLTFKRKRYYTHKLISKLLFGDDAFNLFTDHIDGRQSTKQQSIQPTFSNSSGEFKESKTTKYKYVWLYRCISPT